MERIEVRTIIGSKSADDDKKGDLVFQKIIEVSESQQRGVLLDFKGVELVNTAFLNNAVGRLFNKAEFDISKHGVHIANMDDAMIDLLKETISVARELYKVQ